MTTIWLVVVLVGLFVWVRRDQLQYARFKQLEDGPERARWFWRWTAQSFVILAGGAAVTLALLGRWDAVLGIPAEFQAVAAWFQPGEAARQASDDYMLGIAIGLGVGIAIAVALKLRRMRKLFTPTVGDIEPLMTRNAAEARAALVLSINAGFSEELFFRLALPLLIADVTGSVPFALVASLVIFGLAHAYQGWKGILGTAFVGAWLALVYFKSGSLLRPMAMHAIIDVIALIVRPSIARWFAARQLRAATV
ncbi:CPBP family intramembrane metalloprotease [Sphingomonas sp. IC-56]|uniref:CPBP family intramembrane glutamic endopeptidase n=1 Tax=Sphingomonas sp. IC-56 TaxID=2898529 RepID=UPI001E561C02|nr:type II CAAX endopeptidase family protein [Sphingomonas sp. IC-56]MCD2324086.1 CPBP family intramembrane metalloprotease [Sphingomonas sp. IC-56]